VVTEANTAASLVRRLRLAALVASRDRGGDAGALETEAADKIEELEEEINALRENP
jgi:hypothetical protein